MNEERKYAILFSLTILLARKLQPTLASVTSVLAYVWGANSDGSAKEYFCGTDQTTVDCFPPLLLEPNGAKNLSNSSGGQIDLISPNKNAASGNATINWTLTYPQ